MREESTLWVTFCFPVPGLDHLCSPPTYSQVLRLRLDLVPVLKPMASHPSLLPGTCGKHPAEPLPAATPLTAFSSDLGLLACPARPRLESESSEGRAGGQPVTSVPQ